MSKDNFRSGYVAIVGRPNVGKSTLMNRLIGQKIAITSSKPQTTRNRIMTVYTDERGQIIFLDTPGMNKAVNKLGDYMYASAVSTLNDADCIIFLVEICDYIGAAEKSITDIIRKINKPVLLVINKIDNKDPEQVLKCIELYSKEMAFSEVIPVSAINGKNTDELIKVIYEYLPEGPMFFDEDTLTDQPMKQIVAEIIREKALYCLDNEVPHGIAVVVDKYHERTRKVKSLSSDAENTHSFDEIITDIEASLICEKESHKGIIIGKAGSMLKKIGSTARYDIEKLTDCKVNLKLWVKVKKDWRDKDTELKNFGYDKKELNG